MKHTVSCIVRNYAGVLASIGGSFAKQGINIASLAVGETEDRERSRMTIVVNCREEVLTEVVKHLNEIDDVMYVEDIGSQELIERELMLVKVTAKGEDIAKIVQLVEIFHASVAGMGEESLTIEMTGQERRVDALLSLLQPFGIIEVARTGRVAVKSEERSD